MQRAVVINSPCVCCSLSSAEKLAHLGVQAITLRFNLACDFLSFRSSLHPFSFDRMLLLYWLAGPFRMFSCHCKTEQKTTLDRWIDVRPKWPTVCFVESTWWGALLTTGFDDSLDCFEVMKRMYSFVRIRSYALSVPVDLHTAGMHVLRAVPIAFYSKYTVLGINDGSHCTRRGLLRHLAWAAAIYCPREDSMSG